jgi:hypothetical protein
MRGESGGSPGDRGWEEEVEVKSESEGKVGEGAEEDEWERE